MHGLSEASKVKVSLRASGGELQYFLFLLILLLGDFTLCHGGGVGYLEMSSGRVASVAFLLSLSSFVSTVWVSCGDLSSSKKG